MNDDKPEIRQTFWPMLKQCLTRVVLTGVLLMAITTHVAADEWQLVWSDEFDGPSINSGNWSHEVNAWGGGNNELQYYTSRSQNSFIRDSKLVIRAIKEVFTGPEGTRQYTSARLRSANKRDFKYGRIEARIKMPAGQGLWPAFWMLPTDWEYGGWPTSGEIDIMEFRGDQPKTLHGTIHYGGPLPAHTFTGTTLQTPTDLSEDFHVYGIEWEEGVIRWYFDGQLYLTQSEWFSGNGTYPAPFDRRFHLLLNVAVGGNFLPNPPPDADYFPQEMEVDWVRVYERATPIPRAPFPGPEAPTLPTRIESENFDSGGQGVSYLDNTKDNLGGAYRADEMVDIQSTTDVGGGHNIGWITPGEYLEYTVNVGTEGLYRLKARVATPSGPDGFDLRITPSSGPAITRSAEFDTTGGFQSWTTVEVGEFQLPAGIAVIRFTATTNEFNLNWIEAELITAGPAPVGPAFEVDFDDASTVGPTGGVIGCDWGYGNPFHGGSALTSFVPHAGGFAYNIAGNLVNGGDSYSYVAFYVRTHPDINAGRDFSHATHLQFDARVNAGNNLAWQVRLEDTAGDSALEYLNTRVSLGMLGPTFQRITIPITAFTQGSSGVAVDMALLRAITIFADGGPASQTPTLMPRLTIDNLRLLAATPGEGGSSNPDRPFHVGDVTAINNLIAGRPANAVPRYGDVNGDGFVTQEDAALLVDHVINGTPLP